MLTEGLEEKRYSDVVSKQEGLEQAMSDSVAFSLFKPNHCLIPAEPRCVERVFVDEGKTTSTAPVRERGSSRRAGNSTRAGREPRSTDSRGQEPICDPERCYTAEPRGSSGPVLALEGPDQNSNQLPMLRCGADGETAFAREQLQRCNLEMRVSHHPSRTPLSWTACCNEFEKMFKTVYVSRVETALLDLPADFFDSSDISEVNQPPVREIPEHIEASDELVGIRCVRRPPIFKTSSSVDTEGSKGQHGEPRNRFVDDEAACSNSAESATEDEEISTSMAQFIIDGSNPNSNTSRSRENDDEMMAFYRRTAHASQNDSIFAQPPKRFATSRKPLALPPAAETTDAGDDTDFGGLDWISDIEIP